MPAFGRRLACQLITPVLLRTGFGMLLVITSAVSLLPRKVTITGEHSFVEVIVGIFGGVRKECLPPRSLCKSFGRLNRLRVSRTGFALTVGRSATRFLADRVARGVPPRSTPMIVCDGAHGLGGACVGFVGNEIAAHSSVDTLGADNGLEASKCAHSKGEFDFAGQARNVRSPPQFKKG